MGGAPVVGLIHPAVDAHTLGVSSIAQLIEDCGGTAVMASPELCQAVQHPLEAENSRMLASWIERQRIDKIGFSYRLDPADAVKTFKRFVSILHSRKLLRALGGPIEQLCFAGLPSSCAKVSEEFGDRVAVFRGDETPEESLQKLGIPARSYPFELSRALAYDNQRLAFAHDLLKRDAPGAIRPVGGRDYPQFGTKYEHLLDRLSFHTRRRLPPLMRAHVGPYLAERREAIKLFLEWCRELGSAGYLDVLSIGTSQLSQSNFGEDWGDKPNGGGVPINSVEEYEAVYEAARPMLVRTYAGTKNVPALARLYEKSINSAWHALSLWWFSKLDGRGPYGLRENLEQHFETLRVIAASGKPFEPNVPHHFAFRGSDDVSYIVAGVLAARAAKASGIRSLILQIMLNTPKYTWGVQDLAKARALLTLASELEGGNFRVFLQPRAGLDYFSPDLDKARAQLASVTALMDDIDPHNVQSPPLIHVVSYSEASHLADPAVVNESVRITGSALEEYRKLRAAGEIPDMAADEETNHRTNELLREARCVLHAIAQSIRDPLTPGGLYEVFRAGFLPVPYLWIGREEFPEATRWQTRLVKGAMRVVRRDGRPLPVEERMEFCRAATTQHSFTGD